MKTTSNIASVIKIGRSIFASILFLLLIVSNLNAQRHFFGKKNSDEPKSLSTKKDSVKVSSIALQFAAAKDYYQRGKIDSALQYINWLMQERTFEKAPKNVKAEFYNLNANCYLFQNQPNEAEDNIRKMLALQPFYAEENANPNDLQLLSDKVKLLSPRTLAKNKIGISGGLGQTSIDPRALKQYSVFEGNKNIPQGEYTPKTGIYIAATIERAVSAQVSFEIKPAFIQQNFSYFVDNSSIELPNFSFKEQLNTIMIPLGIKYSLIPSKNFTPYFQTGYFYRKVLTANRSVNNSGNVPIEVSYFGFDHGVYYGGGFLFTRKHNSFTLDLNFFNSIDYLSNPKKRYSFDEDVLNTILFQYNFIQGDVSLSNAVLSVGYARHLNYKVFKWKK